MRELVDTLYEMNGPFNCPHGRPVVICLGLIWELTEKNRKNRSFTLE